MALYRKIEGFFKGEIVRVVEIKIKATHVNLIIPRHNGVSPLLGKQIDLMIYASRRNRKNCNKSVYLSQL